MIALSLVGTAAAHSCPSVDVDDLAATAAPAVLVLGERHGARPDMRRARQVVRALQSSGAPVRLALEAVHESNQPVLDAFAAGELPARKLRAELRWQETWGHAWGPYRPLLKLGRRQVELVAAGLELGPKPEDREVTIPDGYDALLQAAMSAHGHGHGHGGLSDEVRARFTTSMAWRDFRIAELAADGWAGDGYLVILTGRGHVEGSMGTNWQVTQLVDAPVHSAVLAHDGARCLPGDRVWSD